jgi:hypothetical protein
MKKEYPYGLVFVNIINLYDRSVIASFYKKHCTLSEAKNKTGTKWADNPNIVFEVAKTIEVLI